MIYYNKNKKVILSMLLIMLNITFLFAQTIIEGNVIDFQTNRSLKDVTLTLENETHSNNKQVVVSNDKGEFLFNVDFPKGTYLLTVSAINYETKKNRIFINEDKKIRIDFVLTPINLEYF
ncbi:hypothetical protein AS361_11580 [Myroides marinus]|uniref:carboxypeptidase-like regulatory domain-containing protein n=1 Tax=Myroides marinus TaxID=703342 RepID=UPI0007423D75|nr:carboxypeptidase-like regulatory domain-containing protein [Myroides marinus]KUF45608.1 hypothetical protein AS361_11580 [Myroides marinus]